jgi:hypothetical protein
MTRLAGVSLSAPTPISTLQRKGLRLDAEGALDAAVRPRVDRDPRTPFAAGAAVRCQAVAGERE